MCGRFTQYYTWRQVHAYLNLFSVPAKNTQPRYNIAPTQEVDVAVEDEEGQRVLRPMRWGLIPAWAKEESFGAKTFNARCETVAEKPSFRSAFKSRRCVVPASGYYEWRTVEGVKQPYHITMPDTPVMAFAGLWEANSKVDEEPIHSFTIITTEASEAVQEVHHRMPVILQQEDVGLWLGGDADPEEAGELMVSYAGDLKLDRVDRAVGNVKNQGAELVVPESHCEAED